MSKKNVCFMAQFPPPIHGLSKAVDTLYNSNLTDEFEFENVNLTNNKKFVQTIFSILKSKADLFYFTISQSKGGNIRDLILLNLLRFRKKKCLIHLHGGYFRQLVDNDMGSIQRKFNLKAISKLEGVIVLSKSLKSIFEGMIDDEKIHIVSNCVDDEYLMSDEDFKDKRKIFEQKEIYNVLYLSNFIRTKGYPEVLELARLEKIRCESGGIKRFHFNFAGKFFEKVEETYFFKYIKDNALEDYVTYHGVVDGDQKRQLLKDNDIFMLLTRYPIEGQPISILEAMGNGMVIVTTNHAGIPDIVEKGVHGFISTNNNISEIENWLLENISYFPKISEQNRLEIKKNYTEDVYLSNMKDVFRKCSL